VDIKDKYRKREKEKDVERNGRHIYPQWRVFHGQLHESIEYLVFESKKNSGGFVVGGGRP